MTSQNSTVTGSRERIAALAPGDFLGRFQLIALIASGGMGKVWAARQRGDRGFEKVVAVKTAIETFLENPDFEKLFLDEARVAARIQHPNVCAVLDLGDDDGVLYLAMEWVNGSSLSALLQAIPDRKIDPRVAARIFAQACAGLHAAHELTDENGNSLAVVHRDISPQNLLLTAEGHVKVADFGVARAKDQAHQTTSTGEIKGKIGYMAPEQFTSTTYDRRADIFALGCTLYLAVVGEKPFDGIGMAVIYNVVQGVFPRPSERVENFPAELERVILRAMASKPDNRYATAEEMRGELEAYLAASGPPCTEVDVMKVITAAIGPSIKERTTAIRTAAKTIESTGSARVSIPRPAPDDPSAGTASVDVDMSRGSTIVSGGEVPRSAKGARWIFGLGAVAVVVLAVAAAKLTPRAQATAPATAASVQTTSGTPSAVPSVSVRIRAEPPGARLAVDDGPAVEGTYEARVPRDDRSHSVRVFADGHEEERRVLSFADAVDIEVRLKPVRTAPRTTTAQPVVRVPSVRPQAPVTPAVKPDVAHPLDTATPVAKPPVPDVSPTTPGKPRKPIDYTDPI
jgi:serine/threonine-protein kinase